MNFKARVGLMSAASVLLLSSTAWTAPVFNPATGHYYERVESDGVTWNTARTAAESMSYLGTPGHLATITDSFEQDFIAQNLLPGQSTKSIYHLGGKQSSSGIEPAGGWEWITGEPWAYTNWSVNNPNNDSGQDVLAIYGNPSDTAAYTYWDDYWDNLGTHTSGYIVEYPVSEPTTLALTILGIAGLGWRRRRRS